jgi:hypothetical protein
MTDLEQQQNKYLPKNTRDINTMYARYVLFIRKYKDVKHPLKKKIPRFGFIKRL